MKNNSLAMLTTIAAVVAIASVIGFFNPETCTVQAVDGWASCEAIAAQRAIGGAVFAAAAVIGAVVWLIRRRKSTSL